MKTLHVLMAGTIVFLATAITAQARPELRNTEVDSRSTERGLKTILTDVIDRSDEPVWIGYEVPQIPGHRSGCGDMDRGSCVCRLERRGSTYHSTDDHGRKPYSDDMVVLFRAEDGALGELRAYSDFCVLDAGGVPFVWLEDVDPLESIEFLENLTFEKSHRGRSYRDAADDAVMVIGFHDHPAAFAAMKRFVDPEQDEELRETATFWIGELGGAEGVDVLERILKDDPSGEVREKAVFALYVSDEPRATDLLIRAARNDKRAHVREQAIFWLAQEASDQAADAIIDAVYDDPDTEVKEQAVFALSQLPRDEGIPHLIRVARTSRNPDVREQAIFWLGQSGDDRALEFFEEILGR